jgi:hypothetical protein
LNNNSALKGYTDGIPDAPGPPRKPVVAPVPDDDDDDDDDDDGLKYIESEEYNPESEEDEGEGESDEGEEESDEGRGRIRRGRRRTRTERLTSTENTKSILGFKEEIA